jgi:phosphatidate cytidylyltransferase
MSNLVRRNVNNIQLVSKRDEAKAANLHSQSEDEMEPLPSVPSGEEIPQDKGTIEAFDSTLKTLNPRVRNWIVRAIFGFIMVSGFTFVCSQGPLAITILILGIQFKCFHEIITIGYVVYKSHHLPWFRSISWFLLITSNYYFYGESLIEKFSILLRKDDFLAPFVTYHRFISFCLYTMGFVAFVVTLKKTYYLKQFTLFGYTHVALLLIVTQSNLMIQNVFEG